ncbi:hypothetical protein LTR36_001438 [Oleoguttula mirabilis]|uniref:Uncharacterized protein n=1 Tax=Oleoguttula mirabilis TaxID=1507867 RepID=A0AAV9JNU8_9PEZI|nr:hypothetical protein LTR36_001438 [Oleoguttula mirabilis]
METASLSPPSSCPSHETPRSNITMAPSKEAPAAMVCTALRAEEPEEGGREPPEEVLLLSEEEDRLAEVVVPALLEEVELLERQYILALEGAALLETDSTAPTEAKADGTPEYSKRDGMCPWPGWCKNDEGGGRGAERECEGGGCEVLHPGLVRSL